MKTIKEIIETKVSVAVTIAIAIIMAVACTLFVTCSNERINVNLCVEKVEVPPPLTVYSLYSCIVDCELQEPDIVMAQAMLETGWLSSAYCQQKHNCFGLYDSNTGEYMEFEDWRESVKAYGTMVQYKYDTESYADYFDFLDKIGYAADPLYLRKVKAILPMLDELDIKHNVKMSKHANCNKYRAIATVNDSIVVILPLMSEGELHAYAKALNDEL